MKQYKTDQVSEMGLKVSDNRKEAIEYKGMVDCAKKIYKNEGAFAFYKGLTPNLLKVFPSAGLFFLSYEATLIFLGGNNEKTD